LNGFEDKNDVYDETKGINNEHITDENSEAE